MGKFTLNNINKSNWKPFSFEKIAKRISESVDPNTTDLKVYYGLEHLDAETIHIRGNGTPEEVSGGKLKCYPGDVIFGKRRAYQRKAGIVTQRGICSAHSFVFRANEEVIDEQLFPFFLHSNQFMHRMIDISVGGLSPTINWSDLKHQEFLLPPKEQQSELSELLWMMDDVIETDLKVLERLQNYTSVFVENFLNDDNTELEKVLLKDIAFINKYSLTNKTDKNYEFSYIDLSSIEPRKLLETQKIIFKNSPSRARRIVKDDSIIISTVRPYQLCNIHIEKNDSEYVASTGTAVINFKSNINPKLIFEQFFTKRYMKFIEDRMTGTNYPAITARDLENFEVYINSQNITSDKFVNWIINSNWTKSELESRLQSSKILLKSLINQIF